MTLTLTVQPLVAHPYEIHDDEVDDDDEVEADDEADDDEVDDDDEVEADDELLLQEVDDEVKVLQAKVVMVSVNHHPKIQKILLGQVMYSMIFFFLVKDVRLIILKENITLG